jgi:ATP-dependent exoDNAse (exonuclease V) beta subunit
VSSFTIYSSSAGSGKTYTLAKEYLKLALMDDPATGQFQPGYYRHILAVTFTNDAAHEMKQRILTYLRGFAQFDELPEAERKKYAALRQQVLDELNATRPESLDAAELTRRAGLVFNRMLHRYTDFAVGTLDSFTQRVVTTFAEELDLPANFETSLEQDLLLEAAIENLLARVGHEEFGELTDLLAQFAEQKAESGGNFNQIAPDLARVGKLLLEEHQHEALERFMALTPAELSRLFQRLKSTNEALDERLKAPAQRAVALLDGAGLEAADFIGGSRGIVPFFYKWADEADFDKGLSATALRALDEADWCPKKAPVPIRAKVGAIQEELRACLRELYDLVQTHQPRYLLYHELGKLLQQMALLGYLRSELTDLQVERRQLHISNYGKAVQRVVTSEPMPFVYERLGEKYRHILLDEFQDTSGTQWTNFLPLVSNSLGGGYFSLAVGDGKQAIYGWRGGEMTQIVRLHNADIDALLPPPTAPDYELLFEHYLPLRRGIRAEALQNNFRSCREIIAFNNDLFGTLLGLHGPEFPLLELAYATYEQKPAPNAPTGGHVQVDFLEWPKDTPDPMPERVLALVREAEAAGYAWGDIAVLCRKNRDSKRIADFLKKKDYAIVSADSLLLRFSPAVQFVLAVLRVLHAPDNTLARFEALQQFYRVVLHEPGDEATDEAIRRAVGSASTDGLLGLLSSRGYRLDPFRLQQAGLYELTEKLLVLFRLFDRVEEAPYLFRLLDVVLDFSTRQSAHLSDFLRFWEEKQDSLAIQTPAGANAVTVTSVHKSKGLEYPVVIVPHADWERTIRDKTMLWFDLSGVNFEELTVGEDETGTPRRLRFAPIGKIDALHRTPLAAQLQQQEEKAFIENLNMLYVANTRAVDRLYLVAYVEDFTKKGPQKTVAYLLHQFLTERGFPAELLPDRHTYCLTCGQPKAESSARADVPETLEIETVISHDRTNRVRLRRLAEKLFDLETFEKSRERGYQLRAALARVTTPADVPAALESLGREGWLSPHETEGLRAGLDALLRLPTLAPLFAPGPRVETEREILLPDGEIFRPDRVVWLPDGRVVVLLYKTGDKKEAHRKEARRGADLFRQMGFPKAEAKIVYLDWAEVQDVEPELQPLA